MMTGNGLGEGREETFTTEARRTRSSLGIKAEASVADDGELKAICRSLPFAPYGLSGRDDKSFQTAVLEDPRPYGCAATRWEVESSCRDFVDE
jgi:hypothetical protein